MSNQSGRYLIIDSSSSSVAASRASPSVAAAFNLLGTSTWECNINNTAINHRCSQCLNHRFTASTSDTRDDECTRTDYWDLHRCAVVRRAHCNSILWPNINMPIIWERIMLRITANSRSNPCLDQSVTTNPNLHPTNIATEYSIEEQITTIRGEMISRYQNAPMAKSKWGLFPFDKWQCTTLTMSWYCSNTSFSASWSCFNGDVEWSNP